MQLDFLTALALAGVAYVAGHLVVRFVPVLGRARIPEPILGGVLFAVAFLALRAIGVEAGPPTSGRSVDALVALLTTNMGLHVTPTALREGWRLFGVLLLAAAALFVAQFLLALPWGLLTGTPVRTAIVAGPLALVGAPFNLNPPAQIEPVRALFADAYPALRETAQGVMMVGVVLGIVLAGLVGKRLLRRADAEPPQPPEEEAEVRERLARHAHDWALLVALVLAIVAIAFRLQDLVLGAFPAMRDDHLPVVVLGYLLGAAFRLGSARLAGAERFPTRALDELLLGPTMGLVFAYALMSLPLHHLGRVTLPRGRGGRSGVAGSVAAAWLLFPVLARLTDRYYASVVATAFLAITTAWGPVGMGHLRFFMRDEGPVKPMPVVMPLNAFFLFPWLAVLLTRGIVALLG